jgi:hypothetical protein
MPQSRSFGGFSTLGIDPSGKTFSAFRTLAFGCDARDD